MKITYAGEAPEYSIRVSQMERGKCYLQEGESERIVLKTDEGSVVALKSGVLFAADHFNGVRFRELEVELVIQ